jgi:hypothetical protein
MIHPCPGLCRRDVPRSLLDTLWFDPEQHERAVDTAQRWFTTNKERTP